jgi:hypothetical protein
MKISFIYLSFLLTFAYSLAAAQVSNLNPEQTVNAATREMGFSLPLGIVQGVNGHNYPISLKSHSE